MKWIRLSFLTALCGWVACDSYRPLEHERVNLKIDRRDGYLPFQGRYERALVRSSYSPETLVLESS